MPLIHCNFFSQALQLSTSMDVILPLPKWTEGVEAQPPATHPVLYLLHGMSDDHTIWQRRTSIERYVENLDLAVVMPAVHRSFYTDMAVGFRYWTFISEELPYIVQTLFHLSPDREHTFAAGLSMGGYGAFKLALSHPERFAAAASLSGALDMAKEALGDKAHGDSPWQVEMRRIFGDPEKIKGSENDLFALVKRLASSDRPKPRLYQWCGRQDFLYKANVRFRKHAQKHGLDLRYEESDGTHEWRYWDWQIQQVLDWMGFSQPG
ncbi:MAG TPA: alpha/beta hydrolase family protein [Anaerolineaceae bacterium]